MPDAKPTSRRWTVIASGLLVAAFGLVVIYTSRGAFFSPIAVVVVAAIGLTALLLQIRFRQAVSRIGPTPTLLNACGVIFAMGAVFADVLKVSDEWTELMALGAVGCFGISSVILLEALRKPRAISK